MRDILLYGHIILGIALVVLPILILLELHNKRALKPLATIAAITSWLLLLPAGKLYLTFYPATKTLIKAGTRPWAHTIFMETKEHWGLLLPIIATTAAVLVWQGKSSESKKWWVLLAVMTGLIGLAGMIVTSGAQP